MKNRRVIIVPGGSTWLSKPLLIVRQTVTGIVLYKFYLTLSVLGHRTDVTTGGRQVGTQSEFLRPGHQTVVRKYENTQ